MGKIIGNFVDKFTVNRYYKMSTQQLEIEASKYQIGGYADEHGVLRERIIEQLLQKDTANNSRFAIFISIFALVVSFLALFINVGSAFICSWVHCPK